MNVYDFDNTIYKGDSTVDFIKWCTIKMPYLPLLLIKGGITYGFYKAGIGTKTYSKEKLYKFIQFVPDIDKWVNEFWDEHLKNIKKWYINYKKDDDVIISASPEFLLKPICKRLGIKHLMASKVDKHTGFYLGENCYGEEKVKRFFEKFDGPIDDFFSDSLSDLPLARIAQRAFIVKGDNIIPWNI